VGKIVRLWNPRGNRSLARYWVAFDEQIRIDGDTSEQAGVLSLQPVRGTLHARLQAIGCDVEETVNQGEDVSIRINGLTLFVGVKALDDRRMLVEFGKQPGCRVNVTLESVRGTAGDPNPFPPAGVPGGHAAVGISSARPRAHSRG